MNDLLLYPKSAKYEQLIDESFVFSNENVDDYAKHFEDAINLLSNDFTKTIKVQVFLAEFVRELSKKFEIRLDEIAYAIGKKPSQLDHKLDAPHLWGTISELVTKGKGEKTELIKSSNENIRDAQVEALDQVDDLKDELQLSIDQASKLVTQKVVDLRRTVVAIAKATKKGGNKTCTG